MKLLFDENLSHKLVSILSDIFPGCEHVRNIGLKRSPDSDIWEYAKEHDYIIVSKDADFHQRSFVHHFPPKVIAIFSGNCPTTVVENLVRKNEDRIRAFARHSEASMLSLTP
jgi:predicted nuclease of predicted toxin-antitoxin system